MSIDDRLKLIGTFDTMRVVKGMFIRRFVDVNYSEFECNLVQPKILDLKDITNGYIVSNFCSWFDKVGSSL